MVSDSGNLLPAKDVLTGLHQEILGIHVAVNAVEKNPAHLVFQDNPGTEAPHPAGLVGGGGTASIDHFAISHRHYRGSLRCGEVNPAMQ